MAWTPAPRARPRPLPLTLTRRQLLGRAAGLAVGLGLLAVPACYDAYVSVHVTGAPAGTAQLRLVVAVGAWRATELYPGGAEDLRFYLPDGASQQALTVAVSALDARQKVLATGSATLDRIGDAIDNPLPVALGPVP